MRLEDRTCPRVVVSIPVDASVTRAFLIHSTCRFRSRRLRAGSPVPPLFRFEGAIAPSASGPAVSSRLRVPAPLLVSCQCIASMRTLRIR